MGSCENWIGDRFFDGDRQGESVSMKPLIAACFEEAFRIAVCDCLPDASDARRVEIFRDIHAITEEEWQSISPAVLGRNTMIRLIGGGGFTVRGVYDGNASSREVFDACIANSEENQTDRLIGDLRASGSEITEEPRG